MTNSRREQMHDRPIRDQELRSRPSQQHARHQHTHHQTSRVDQHLKLTGNLDRPRSTSVGHLLKHPRQNTSDKIAPLSRSQPIPLPTERSNQATPARRRQQQRQKERLQVRTWESMVSISFTLIWTAVALTGIAKLRPVQQETHQSLSTLTSEVEQLQARVNRARRKVELGLDPTQAETAIRESLNYVPFNQLGVVFEEPASLVE